MTSATEIVILGDEDVDITTSGFASGVIEQCMSTTNLVKYYRTEHH